MKKIFFLTIFLIGALTLANDNSTTSDSSPPPPKMGKPPSSDGIEGTFCEECERKKHSELTRIQDNAGDIEKKAQSQLDQDPEYLKKRIAHAKARMLKKIKNKACPKQMSPKDNDDDSSDDFIADSPGGSDDMQMMSSRYRSEDPMELIAKDPDAMDEVQDAIEDKQEACRKKQERVAQAKTNPTMPQVQQGNLYGMNQMNQSMMMGMGNNLNMMNSNMMGLNYGMNYGMNMGNYGSSLYSWPQTNYMSYPYSNYQTTLPTMNLYGSNLTNTNLYSSWTSPYYSLNRSTYPYSMNSSYMTTPTTNINPFLTSYGR
jgi:hypothetical protein